MELQNLLTVVIPCKNEKENIRNVLNSLNKQKNSKGLLVIVADVSDDMTTIHYINAERNKNIQILTIDGGYPAYGRHQGALMSETPYTLFLDSDMEIKDKDFLEKILNEIITKKGSLLTCKVRTIDNKYNYVYKFFDLIQKFHRITGPFALGGIMLFNTESYFKLGGFNPNDKFAEDYNLSKKVNSKDFILSKNIIHTSSRRLKSKGVWYMAKLMFLSFLNRNNQRFFEKTHSYWS
jgi:glycosyltransferase involved in cell wall biosynthesis